MKNYVYKRNKEGKHAHTGIHLLHLTKQWEKLMVAARIIAAIDNPSDILVVSNNDYGHRAAIKFATHLGSQYVAQKWIPGMLTNQITKKFIEPRLLIVADPRSDHQALTESAYMNIPTIAFCDTDSPLSFVDIAVPWNNKGKKAIATMFWLLTREVLHLRGQLNRGEEWDVVVDLFMHRDLQDAEKAKELKAAQDKENEDEGEGRVGDTRKKYRADEEDDEEDEDAEEDEHWGAEGGATYAK
jgi:small subunit ribosomal protein SAe